MALKSVMTATQVVEMAAPLTEKHPLNQVGYAPETISVLVTSVYLDTNQTLNRKNE